MKYITIINKTIKINIKINSNEKTIPKKKKIKKWINAISNIFYKKKNEISINIVNINEMKKINFKYRKKKYATNILSFKNNIKNKKTNNYILGDLIICSKLIKLESIKQKKKISSHWAHIIIHGILHLLKYNHNNKKNKLIMEKKEIELLKKIGFKNPYIT